RAMARRIVEELTTDARVEVSSEGVRLARALPELASPLVPEFLEHQTERRQILGLRCLVNADSGLLKRVWQLMDSSSTALRLESIKCLGRIKQRSSRTVQGLRRLLRSQQPELISSEILWSLRKILGSGCLEDVEYVLQAEKRTLVLGNAVQLVERLVLTDWSIERESLSAVLDAMDALAKDAKSTRELAAVAAAARLRIEARFIAASRRS
ncbi:MAG: hypothetical protein AAF517_19200, partial [Planctomycetota bacterium]